MPPLIARLVLDAQSELLRAIDHVPAPGRNARLGQLNQPGWAVAHAAATHDAWLNHYTRGLERDPWCADWYRRQSEAGWANPVPVTLDEARETFVRVVERTMPWLESLEAGGLAARVELTGTPYPPVVAGYLVARAAAHLFAHAGELTVAASLVGAGDLGLPGGIPRASRHDDAGPEGPLGARLALALARDAQSEVERVAAALPAPVHGPVFAPRLSSGWSIVAHVALGQDRAWNATAQEIDRDPWLLGLGLDELEPGDPEPPDPGFEAVLDAYRRVLRRGEPFLDSLAERDDVPRQALTGLAWTAAHLFAHAGELAAIGSLAGMPDADLPGPLAATGTVSERALEATAA